MRPRVPCETTLHRASSAAGRGRSVPALLLVTALLVTACGGSVQAGARAAGPDHAAVDGSLTGPAGPHTPAPPGAPTGGVDGIVGAASGGTVPGTASGVAPSSRSGPAPLLTPAVRAALSAELLRLRSIHHLPGVQAVVSLADGATWIGDAGYADVAARVRVTPTTVFDAGSITKTFVSALVLQLVDEHVLSLDDLVSRWLPGDAAARGVTIRELLDHTSGITEPFDSPALLSRLGARPSIAWTPAGVLAYAGRAAFAPGHGWLYSNANYLLLGQIVRAATGRDVGSLIQSRFLGPLGLAHTFLQGSSPPPAAFVRATGYDAVSDASWPQVALGDGTRYVPFTSLATALGTAGALVTTADDLSRWAEALYGGHLLPPSTLATMLDFGLTRGLHPRWPYGLGVQRVTLDGQVAIGHSGLLSGFHAAMRYFPASGAAVVVLTNADATDPDLLVSGLLAALGTPGPGIP